MFAVMAVFVVLAIRLRKHNNIARARKLQRLQVSLRRSGNLRATRISNTARRRRRFGDRARQKRKQHSNSRARRRSRAAKRAYGQPAASEKTAAQRLLVYIRLFPR